MSFDVIKEVQEIWSRNNQFLFIWGTWGYWGGICRGPGKKKSWSVSLLLRQIDDFPLCKISAKQVQYVFSEIDFNYYVAG